MTILLLLAGSFALAANEARAQTAKDGIPVEAAGPSLDRREAEELIYDYLAEDLPLLVGMRQRSEYIAGLKADPPRFDAQDRYHFNPPGGLLEFEYDGERGALVVRAAIHRYRGREQGHGLSFEQISKAVHRYGKDGAGLGGGWLDTAPMLDGVFLRHDFVGPPRSGRRFARQVGDLVEAANRWSRKDYLKALQAYALTLAPPASATAEAGGFRATMALTDNPELYARIWSRPPGALKPFHISVHDVKPGTELVLAIHIVDPLADSEGVARVEATTRLLGPDGIERGTSSEVSLWLEPPPPAGHFQGVCAADAPGCNRQRALSRLPSTAGRRSRKPVSFPVDYLLRAFQALSSIASSCRSITTSQRPSFFTNSASKGTKTGSSTPCSLVSA
jgi:hypothetical protein